MKCRDEMRASDDEVWVQEPKCVLIRSLDKSNLWQASCPRARIVSGLNAKPPNPQELHRLGGMSWSRWVGRRDNGMVDTEYLGIPIGMGVVTHFG